MFQTILFFMCLTFVKHSITKTFGQLALPIGSDLCFT